MFPKCQLFKQTYDGCWFITNFPLGHRCHGFTCLSAMANVTNLHLDIEPAAQGGVWRRRTGVFPEQPPPVSHACFWLRCHLRHIWHVFLWIKVTLVSWWIRLLGVGCVRDDLGMLCRYLLMLWFVDNPICTYVYAAEFTLLQHTVSNRPMLELGLSDQETANNAFCRNVEFKSTKVAQAKKD